MPAKSYYKCADDLIKETKSELEKGLEKAGRKDLQILVIGSLGRCGSGAIDLCKAVGVPESSLLKWDLKETAPGGPFREIRESDVSFVSNFVCQDTRLTAQIFVNCIYLSADIPKFVTEDFLKEGERRLSVVCDVSCRDSLQFFHRTCWLTHKHRRYDQPVESYTFLQSAYLL